MTKRKAPFVVIAFAAAASLTACPISNPPPVECDEIDVSLDESCVISNPPECDALDCTDGGAEQADGGAEQNDAGDAVADAGAEADGGAEQADAGAEADAGDAVDAGALE